MFDDNICSASCIHTPKRKRITKRKKNLSINYVLSDGVTGNVTDETPFHTKYINMEIRDGKPFNLR